MPEQYVIDASMGCKDGLFTFCPIQGDINSDFIVVTGLNYISTTPPTDGKLVAIVHPDGQEAVEAFCEEFKEELARLKSVSK